jgi:Rrf2 family iron-sulfur cluster assembly transcriptional regulator
MRLTTKGRYAVTAMLDLALHDAHGPVPLNEISRRQGISLSYLEQLFLRLRRARLVHSVRGPGGGYTLARPADRIAIAEVIDAVDENMDSTACGSGKGCEDDGQCLSHGLWVALSEQIRGFLAGITLADVIARPGIQAIAEKQEHRIQLRAVER